MNNNPTDWTCSICATSNRDNRLMCWHCGATKGAPASEASEQSANIRTSQSPILVSSVPPEAVLSRKDPDASPQLQSPKNDKPPQEDPLSATHPLPESSRLIEPSPEIKLAPADAVPRHREFSLWTISLPIYFLAFTIVAGGEFFWEAFLGDTGYNILLILSHAIGISYFGIQAWFSVSTPMAILRATLCAVIIGIAACSHDLFLTGGDNLLVVKLMTIIYIVIFAIPVAISRGIKKAQKSSPLPPVSHPEYRWAWIFAPVLAILIAVMVRSILLSRFASPMGESYIYIIRPSSIWSCVYTFRVGAIISVITSAIILLSHNFHGDNERKA